MAGERTETAGGAMVPVGGAGERAAIPRAALERVLARAAELQAAAAPEGAEVIPEAQLLEIAREVGLDAAHVRTALAEERARPAALLEEGGWLLEALGGARLSAHRTVPGAPDAVVAALSATFTRHETMTVMRRTDTHHSWEPRDDFGAGLQRMLSAQRYALAGVDVVVATATAVDGTRTLVRLEATLNRARRQARTTVAAVWTAVGGLAAVVAALLVLLPLPEAPRLLSLGGLGAFALLCGATAWGAVRRGYRRAAARAQLRLEQLLDERERG